MGKVEKKIKDIKSIRILFIFDFIIILILVISFFGLGFFSPAIYIFSSLLLICILFQLLLCFIPKGKVIFDFNGITIITRHINTIVSWSEVKGIYYNSFSEILPLLNHFTIDLWIKLEDELIDFDNKFGNIKIYKKEYLNIISYIPRHIFEINEFIIYRNIVEKEKNKYKIQ